MATHAHGRSLGRIDRAFKPNRGYGRSESISVLVPRRAAIAYAGKNSGNFCCQHPEAKNSTVVLKNIIKRLKANCSKNSFSTGSVKKSALRTTNLCELS
jgi:hypothetical protein